MKHFSKKRMLGKVLPAAVIAAALVSVASVGGCSKAYTLETGYAVRPLTASPTEIRGFYAERFTPEARAAQIEREQEMEARRPKPGY